MSNLQQTCPVRPRVAFGLPLVGRTNLQASCRVDYYSLLLEELRFITPLSHGLVIETMCQSPSSALLDCVRASYVECS